MTKKNRKITTITLSALVFAVSLTFGLMGNRSAHAKTNMNLSTTNLSAQFFYQGVQVYALGANNNTIYQLSGSTFNRIGAIGPVTGTVAECDFRAANNQLYCITTTNNIYTVNPANGQATQIGTLSPALNSGTTLLVDFNAMADAIRYIGSNDLNYAVVKNANGVVNTVAVQTPVAFVSGDVNQGANPNLVAGAYDYNQPNQPFTTFYAFDSNLDKLITIATRTATGSSNTGGGQLQTVGTLFDQSGAVDITPNSGFDISTFPQFGNLNVGWLLTDRKLTTFFSVQVPMTLPLGQQQNVGGQSMAVTASDGNTSYSDIMVSIPQTQQ